MKKLIPLVLLAALLLSGCGAGNTSYHQRTVHSTGSHSARAVEAAMDAAERYFRGGFEGCTLVDIRYDGDKTGQAEQEWAEQYDAIDAMVLTSDFRTSQGNPVLNSWSTYKNWNWVMVWDGGHWKVATCGYG